MGEVAVVDELSNAAFQSTLSAAIAREQSDDPLQPVTLIVDSAAHGWALRRQLAARLAPGSGMANVRTLTAEELLGLCAQAWGLRVPTSTDRIVQSAVVGALLASTSGPLSGSAGHPDSAARLARLSDELAWCTLDQQAVTQLQSGAISSTARESITFVADSRSTVASVLGTSPWSAIAEAIAAASESPASPQQVQALGSIIVVARRLPCAVVAVLDVVNRHANVTRIELPSNRSMTVQAAVLDCPDPSTEASLAVRYVADAIASGVALSHIAVLYSNPQPYAGLLETAFDDAGIAWHGPSGAALQATAIAQFTSCLAQMAADRTRGGSGISRPLLMRWMAIGKVHDGSAFVPTGAHRALIREQGLYGDATSWRHCLDGLVAVAAASIVDDSWESAARVRLGEQASTLAALIVRLDDALGRIAGAGTWSELGSALWDAVESFHLHGSWWQASDTERAAHAVIRDTLLGSLPTIDEYVGQLSSPLDPSTSELSELLASALTRPRAMHGSSATGVHVGPISGARGLVFSTVIAVGAAEGLLPPVLGHNPLLPDAAVQLLRTITDDLLTSLEQEAATESDVLAVCSAAARVVVTMPRGAVAGRAIPTVSRYFTATPDSARVPSASAGLATTPPPITPLDRAIRAGIGISTAPADLSEQVDSLVAWNRPAFDRRFGHPGTVDDTPAWSIGDVTLSASGIEQFLHCPYHFFVARVLGVSTDEYADEVDSMPASDFGTLLHHALETFVAQANTAGTLPGYGLEWPPAALQDLRAILEVEIAAAEASGVTGWRPQWLRTRGVIDAALPDFLAVDADEVRADPPVTPLATEQRFGFEGEPVVEVRLSDDVVVRLRGSIDRVDIDEAGTHVGVIDYKTNSANKFDVKLGGGKNPDPERREKVQDLVYDAAARSLFPAATSIDVRFVFVPNRGAGVVVVNADHEPDRPGTLNEILATMHVAGLTGAFPPNPRPKDYCPVCKRLGRTARKVAGLADEDEQIEDVDA